MIEYTNIDSGNYSFKNLLTKYIEKINPKNILEWGPGYSTYLIAQQCTDANIYSIEHDEKWLDITTKRLEQYKPRINIFYKKADNPASQYSTYAYSLFDKYGPFDLIFIDGRRRVECCMVALDVIKDSGILILHDAERKSYRRVIDKYINIIDEKDRTIVFTKKIVTFPKISPII